MNIINKKLNQISSLQKPANYISKISHINDKYVFILTSKSPGQWLKVLSIFNNNLVNNLSKEFLVIDIFWPLDCTLVSIFFFGNINGFQSPRIADSHHKKSDVGKYQIKRRTCKFLRVRGKFFIFEGHWLYYFCLKFDLLEINANPWTIYMLAKRFISNSKFVLWGRHGINLIRLFYCSKWSL